MKEPYGSLYPDFPTQGVIRKFFDGKYRIGE